MPFSVWVQVAVIGPGPRLAVGSCCSARILRVPIVCKARLWFLSLDALIGNMNHRHRIRFLIVLIAQSRKPFRALLKKNKVGANLLVGIRAKANARDPRFLMEYRINLKLREKLDNFPSLQREG
jgi:hypothetical protein